MLIRIRSFINDSILVTPVIIPYLVNLSWQGVSQVTILQLGFSLLLFELIYQLINAKIKNKTRFSLDYICIPGLLLLFYYPEIDWLEKELSLPFTGLALRYKLICLWLLFLYIFSHLLLNIKFFPKIFNTFWVILCLTAIANTIPQFETSNLSEHHFIPLKRNNSKPVILIIVDEYASPTELLKINQSKANFNFSNSLRAIGWEINTNQWSDNYTTIHSLSSIFNYHLINQRGNPSIRKSIFNLRKSLLVYDLEKKGVKIYNWRIFDLGNSKAYSKLYFYEEEQKGNTLKWFFTKSVLARFFQKPSNKFQMAHNRFILEQGFKKINSISTKNSFIYLHLLMPHAPLRYEGELNFKLNKSLNSNENYFNYWNFTNHMLLNKLLQPLSQSNKFKIIVTGDHGYRNIPTLINPHKTFTAYYGFDLEQITQIKSVQDLGSLIYANL
jgi:hypothetical protein